MSEHSSRTYVLKKKIDCIFPSIFRVFGLELSATAVFDYPTSSALATFLSKSTTLSGTRGPDQTLARRSMQQDLAETDFMVVDACSTRLSSDVPSDKGDGFSMDTVPFARWDRDTSRASQRLGATFAR